MTEFPRATYGPFSKLWWPHATSPSGHVTPSWVLNKLFIFTAVWIILRVVWPWFMMGLGFFWFLVFTSSCWQKCPLGKKDSLNNRSVYWAATTTDVKKKNRSGHVVPQLTTTISYDHNSSSVTVINWGLFVFPQVKFSELLSNILQGWGVGSGNHRLSYRCIFACISYNLECEFELIVVANVSGTILVPHWPSVLSRLNPFCYCPPFEVCAIDSLSPLVNLPHHFICREIYFDFS